MSFSKKEKELYKEKCRTVKKIKCKKRYHKKSQLHMKVFQECISIVYSIVYTVIVERKMQTSFKTRFTENDNMAVEKISQ